MKKTLSLLLITITSLFIFTGCTNVEQHSSNYDGYGQMQEILYGNITKIDIIEVERVRGTSRGEGAVAGGALGAVAGAALGGDDPLAGAIVGGIVGSALGAAAGSDNPNAVYKTYRIIIKLDSGKNVSIVQKAEQGTLRKNDRVMLEVSRKQVRDSNCYQDFWGSPYCNSYTEQIKEVRITRIEE